MSTSSCVARNVSPAKLKSGWSEQMLDSSGGGGDIPWPQVCKHMPDPVTGISMLVCETPTQRPFNAYFVDQNYQKMFCKTHTDGTGFTFTSCYDSMDKCQKK